MNPQRTRPTPSRQPPAQRGAAALVVTMLLFFAMVLAVLFSNRTLLSEQRTAANQMRSTQAFEAAEAGLDWALDQVNHTGRVGADCRAVPDLTAASFRSLYLPVAGGARAAAPGCTRVGDAWTCRCPQPAPPTREQPGSGTGADRAAGDDPHAERAGAAVPGATLPGVAFSVAFEPTQRPDRVRLTATGCVGAAGGCAAGAPAEAGATVRIEVALGLLPALPSPPDATVTVRAAFDAGSAAVSVQNVDPSRAIGVRAGGEISASRVRLTPPPGSSTTGMLQGHDVALAGLSPQQLFVATFGLDKARWRDQASVIRLTCSADCTAAVAAAVAQAPDDALVWVEGDLALHGPVVLGSLQHPVALVVSGAAQLDGAVAVTGALYAASLSWSHTDGTGAALRGAAIVEGGYRGDGAPVLVYDPNVLDALARHAGSYARVSGSWREL